jgi:signal transduction histidine kinase
MGQTLRALIYLELHSLPDQDPRKRIALGINFVAICLALILLTDGLLVAMFTNNRFIYYGVGIEVILLAATVLLNQAGKYGLAGLLLFAVAAGAIPYYYFVPDGSVYMRWLSCFILVAAMVYIVALDYSSRRRLVDVLREHARVVEGNLENEEKKNEKKDLFISNAYHEIRNSFFSIFSIINLFNDEKAVDLKMKEWQKAMTHLWTACQIQKNLIDNVLGYERFEIGGATSIFNDLIDIRLLLKNLIDIYSYSADEKKVRIIPIIPEEVDQFVFSDRVKLIQVLSNLLSNAIKYTRRDSKIIVRLRLEEGSWKISIQDQGEGISEQKLQLIFEPFFTESPTGIGLGLYITQRTVELLQGKLTVSSRPGFGSCFTITLPHYSDMSRQKDTRLDYFHYS